MHWKIDNSVYVPIFPVYVIGDDLAARQFVLAVDESLRFLTGVGQHSIAERRYAERIARYRLHQAEFRGRVLRAYQTQCAVCSLRHGRLLDAAHIIGDRAEGGEPVVPNGLSMCKIHHAAFDGNLLGISPDYTVHIDEDLLYETDGPMLRHGLQEMHGRVLVLPARRGERPDRERLAARWAQFGKAGSARQRSRLRLGVDWPTVWTAVEPLLQVLVDDPARYVGVTALGGDEQIWHHAPADIAFDVHVRRVFLRTQLAQGDELQHVTQVARRIHPERSGDRPARTGSRSSVVSRRSTAVRAVCPAAGSPQGRGRWGGGTWG